MKRTAYDILGVRRHATPQDIKHAYEQGRRRLDPSLPQNAGNPDTELEYKLLVDAYSTLSDPRRRDAYDASLWKSVVPEDVITQTTRPVEGERKKVVVLGILVLALLGLGVTYIYENKRSELAKERERIVEAERKADDVTSQRPATDSGRHDQQSWEVQQRQIEERNRREMEMARREGASVHRDLQYAEERARREAEYARQREEYEERQEQRRAQQEAEARRYRERYSYTPSHQEKRGSGVGVLPPTSLTGDERSSR